MTFCHGRSRIAHTHHRIDPISNQKSPAHKSGASLLRSFLFSLACFCKTEPSPQISSSKSVPSSSRYTLVQFFSAASPDQGAKPRNTGPVPLKMCEPPWFHPQTLTLPDWFTSMQLDSWCGWQDVVDMTVWRLTMTIHPYLGNLWTCAK